MSYHKCIVMVFKIHIKHARFSLLTYRFGKGVRQGAPRVANKHEYCRASHTMVKRIVVCW